MCYTNYRILNPYRYVWMQEDSVTNSYLHAKYAAAYTLLEDGLKCSNMQYNLQPDNMRSC